MKTYTVEDVIQAECTLEPIKCKKCGGTNVTFHQYIEDAYCADCGTWQLDYSEDSG